MGTKIQEAEQNMKLKLPRNPKEAEKYINSPIFIKRAEKLHDKIGKILNEQKDPYLAAFALITLRRTAMRNNILKALIVMFEGSEEEYMRMIESMESRKPSPYIG